jgi:hypothetical protein
MPRRRGSFWKTLKVATQLASVGLAQARTPEARLPAARSTRRGVFWVMRWPLTVKGLRGSTTK